MDKNGSRLRALRAEMDRVLDVTETIPLDAAVPTCEGWMVADLVTHLARVYDWAGTIVSRRLDSSPAREEIERHGDTSMPREWLTESARNLVDILEAAEGAVTPIWNFGPREGGAEWWMRRQLHETTVHRVDAEIAAGLPVVEVEPLRALDLLEEVLEVSHIDVVPPEALEHGDGLWLHLHATDVEDAEWTIDTASKQMARAHMKGDVAVRARIWPLSRWLWGRSEPADIESFGDIDAAEAWRRSIFA